MLIFVAYKKRIMKDKLINGQRFTYSNEGDLLEAWYDKDVPNWSVGFKIWFNGETVHTSKGFQSFKKKLNSHITMYNLVMDDTTN